MVHNTRGLRGSDQKSVFESILYPFYRERQNQFLGAVAEHLATRRGRLLCCLECNHFHPVEGDRERKKSEAIFVQQCAWKSSVGANRFGVVVVVNERNDVVQLSKQNLR